VYFSRRSEAGFHEQKDSVNMRGNAEILKKFACPLGSRYEVVCRGLHDPQFHCFSSLRFAIKLIAVDDMPPREVCVHGDHDLD
jgi:hypothetical protein